MTKRFIAMCICRLVSLYTYQQKVQSEIVSCMSHLGSPLLLLHVADCAYVHSCTCRIHWQTTFGGPTTGTTITVRDPNESSPGTREYTTWWVVIGMFVYYVKLKLTLCTCRVLQVHPITPPSSSTTYLFTCMQSASCGVC